MLFMRYDDSTPDSTRSNENVAFIIVYAEKIYTGITLWKSMPTKYSIWLVRPPQTEKV